MLRRVDPYGDLILTAAEMTQFIAELDEELAVSDKAEERDVLERTRCLAERCAVSPSMELHLIGD